MLARGAMITALVCLLSQSPSAEPQHPDSRRSTDARTAETKIRRLGLPFQGTEPPAREILAVRRACAHAAILQQIAIYASLGNREGAEILIPQLRAMGVGAEAVTEAVTWSNVHNSSPDQQSRDAFHCWSARPIELASQAGQ
jgi:hypothetical protein